MTMYEEEEQGVEEEEECLPAPWQPYSAELLGEVWVSVCCKRPTGERAQAERQPDESRQQKHVPPGTNEGSFLPAPNGPC